MIRPIDPARKGPGIAELVASHIPVWGNSFMKHQGTLLLNGIVTHDVKRFIVARPCGFGFIPGEGIELAIDKPEWRGQGRTFTPNSFTEDRVVEYTIKGYSDHLDVPKSFARYRHPRFSC